MSQMPVECKGDNWCPITATANLIGKKWHPVIIHRLIEEGPHGFNSLKEEIGGISSKVLSESLDDLQEKNLLDREVVSEKPVRVKYKLTEAGESLEPVIEEMLVWGRSNLVESDTI
ncbi:MAG: helix-turn-helix transcriptional regulator [Nanohaloarchaea archaeon]|nr:helix-turn-helix transcriptional regulator [Candidatus Nanohaloarchaea archaeon]